MDVAVLKEYTRNYWTEARNTHVGDESYYRLAQLRLLEILKRHLKPMSNVLDVGCGNGEYTASIARNAGRVLAFDISEHLLAAARLHCQALDNVSFFRADLSAERVAFGGQADAVFCMGVFACMPDAAQMTKLLGDFRDYLVDDGLLVLRDSTMIGDERYVRYPGGHLGYYRNKASMIRTLRDEGFSLIEEIALKAEFEPFNDYFVLRKRLSA